MSYVQTVIAQPIDLSASERDGHLHFEDSILAKAGLLMPLHEIRVKYQEAFVEAQGKKYSELVSKHDELVQEYRRVKAILDAANARRFEIMQEHNEAARTANHVSALYNGLKQSLENSSDAFETVSERAEKEGRLKKLRADAEAAVLAASNIGSELIRNQYVIDEAEKNFKAAEVAVVTAKRRLDVFLGKKGSNDPESGLAMS